MLIQKHSTEMEFARFPHEMPAWPRSAYAKASADSPRARFCNSQSQLQKSRRDAGVTNSEPTANATPKRGET
jgi:hypothetical protein